MLLNALEIGGGILISMVGPSVVVSIYLLHRLAVMLLGMAKLWVRYQDQACYVLCKNLDLSLNIGDCISRFWISTFIMSIPDTNRQLVGVQH